MQITNKLVNESFSKNYSGQALTERETDYINLDKVIDYCKQIGESIYYDDDLYKIEVEDGILLYEIIYGIKDGASKDGTDYLREMFEKGQKSTICQQILPLFSAPVENIPVKDVQLHII